MPNFTPWSSRSYKGGYLASRTHQGIQQNFFIWGAIDHQKSIRSPYCSVYPAIQGQKPDTCTRYEYKTLSQPEKCSPLPYIQFARENAAFLRRPMDFVHIMICMSTRGKIIIGYASTSYWRNQTFTIRSRHFTKPQTPPLTHQ